jgi:geranylgeranyl diphosphate synthase type II
MLTAAFDIQDDIIDKSLIKNRKQTVFGKYGAETAILVGNAFLIKGFVVLRDLEVAVQKVNKIFDLVEKAFYKLGNAHALEVELRRKKVSIANYWRIVRMKAASFGADVELGATIGKASEKEIETLKCYGEIIGELAVLRDDFIDIFEVDELRNRIKNELLPMPILYALEDKQRKGEIEEILRKPDITENDVDLIVDCIFKARTVARLIERMRKLVKRSIKTLEGLYESQSRIALHQLSSAMLEGIN